MAELDGVDLMAHLACDSLLDRVKHHREHHRSLMLHQPVIKQGVTPATCSCGRLSWRHCPVIEHLTTELFGRPL